MYGCIHTVCPYFLLANQLSFPEITKYAEAMIKGSVFNSVGRKNWVDLVVHTVYFWQSWTETAKLMEEM